MELSISFIQSKIYEVRGFKVMLDFDLAEIYETLTKRLKEQVRRNIERFPEDFMFELTRQEFMDLRSQIATSSWGGARYLPFAFTEHGVAMLQAVLQSKKAIDTSIQIVRAFVAMRHFLLNPPINEVKELQNEVRQLKLYIEEVFADYNDINEDTQKQLENINQTLSVSNVQFNEIYQAITMLAEQKRQLDKQRNIIGFKTSKNN